MNAFIMIINMMNIFINRERELQFLEERYLSNRAELIIIYGRRRVGKTFLLRKFLEGKKGVYFVVSRLGNILQDFSEAIADQLGVYPPMFLSYKDLFRYMAQESSRERTIFIVDEFQRLAESDPSFLMELQSAWDNFLRNSNIFLVLSGSSIGVIEKIALSSSSPIFGRRTGQLKLKPFTFKCAKEFMKSWPCEDKIRAYAVYGGTPAYLTHIDTSKTQIDNIKRNILEPSGPLHEEPYFLLSTETREPLRYMAILEAMASGATTLGEIASKSGISTNELPRYIRTLEALLDLVEKRYPLLEEGRRGRATYIIKDNFIRFWFKFVRPNLYILELGEVERVAQRVKENLDQYVSQVFEEIAFQHFSHAVPAIRIGKWWKGETEIDGVAIDEKTKTAYFMEAKWTNKPVDKQVLRQLEAKAQEFDWKKNERKEVYYIYSRSGFTFTREEDVELVNLQELCNTPCIQESKT
jgi:AAA+ ATPase superfamily predicted ATPase